MNIVRITYSLAFSLLLLNCGESALASDRPEQIDPLSLKESAIPSFETSRPCAEVIPMPHPISIGIIDDESESSDEGTQMNVYVFIGYPELPKSSMYEEIIAALQTGKIYRTDREGLTPLMPLTPQPQSDTLNHFTRILIDIFDPDAYGKQVPYCEFYLRAYIMKYIQNSEQAKRLYWKSIENGNSDAFAALAEVFEEEWNIEEAKRLLKLGVKSNNSGSMLYLSDILCQEGNDEDAQRLAELANEQGNTHAPFLLSIIEYKLGNIELAILQFLQFSLDVENYGDRGDILLEYLSPFPQKHAELRGLKDITITDALHFLIDDKLEAGDRKEAGVILKMLEEHQEFLALSKGVTLF